MPSARALVRSGLGFATLDVDDSVPPEVAGIEQLHREVGAQAAAQLVEQIERGDTGGAPVVHGRLVEGRWREGASLPAR
jgi:DNA-binding LacI/PurR family transcriptional regulator